MSRHPKHLAKDSGGDVPRLIAHVRQRMSKLGASARGRFPRITALGVSRIGIAAAMIVAVVSAGLLTDAAGDDATDGKATETTATSIRDTQDQSSRDRDRTAATGETEEKKKEEDKPEEEKKDPGPHWVAPSPERISDTYGPRGWRGGEMHWGLDFAAAPGEDNVAAFDGTVVMAQWYGGYGNCVVVKHADGVQTLYGHFSHIDVAPGDEVKAGDVLGQAGATGDATGPHLHFEVTINGEYTDPLEFLRDKGVDI